MQRRHLTTSALAFTALAGFTAAGQAEILFFEAESGTLGSDFATAVNGDIIGGSETNPVFIAGALNGTVIYDSGAGGTGAANVASYQVNFTEAGDYDLYVRIYNAQSGSEDSFFVGADLGPRDDSDFGDATEWHNLNGWGAWNPAFSGLTIVDDGMTWNGDLPIATPAWINLTANFNENLGGDLPDVGAYTVDTPGAHTFQIAGREPNLGIDGFAFIPTAQRELVMADGSGNLFLVPEPASAALIALGGLAMLARRRQA